jgi:hypothetical protein
LFDYKNSIQGIRTSFSPQRNAEQAATVLDAAEEILECMTVTLQAADRVEIDAYNAQARQILGETAFDLAWQLGKEMSLEQSLAYVFSAGDEF